MGILDFRLTYEISPIFLTGGIAGNIGGGYLPIVQLTQGLSFSSLLGGLTLSTDQYYAHFKPLPGKRLTSQAIGTYPFANQATAANAVIQLPLNISMLMVCPAGNSVSYTEKQAVMSGLKQTIDAHNLAGGLYIVNTPSFVYSNCILKDIVDMSSGESEQVEYLWQWNFEMPLTTMAQAQAAQNNLMSKLSNGLQVDQPAGNNSWWSNPDNTVGDPSSGAAGTTLPAATPSGSLSYTGGTSNGNTGGSSAIPPSDTTFLTILPGDGSAPF